MPPRLPPPLSLPPPQELKGCSCFAGLEILGLPWFRPLLWLKTGALNMEVNGLKGMWL